jgi:hypothetical protein
MVMNSKQRRNNRVFVHEVTLYAETDDVWINDFDEKVAEAKGWLQWRTKRKNWTTGPTQWNRITFKFRDGNLATLFALRWK